MTVEQGTRNSEQGFRQLLAWRRADDLAADTYRLSEVVKQRHRWLADQIARAAFSVTNNIAEGYGRSSPPDYLRFVEIACGSLNEVENALHFISRNQILAPAELRQAEVLRQATGNLLFGLARSLRKKLSDGGVWQRGLVRDEAASYRLESEFEPPTPEFPVPGSKFPGEV